MSKKTFLSILGLMLGAGVLALVFFVIASRPVDDASAVVWKVDTKRSDVLQLAFSADSKTLLSRYNGMQRWNVATGVLQESLPRRWGGQYSPNLQILAVKGGPTRTRGATVQGPVWEDIKDKNGFVRRVAKMKSKTIEISEGSFIHLLDLRTGASLQRFPLPERTRQQQVGFDYRQVTFHPTAPYVAASYSIYDPTSFKKRKKVFTLWNLNTGEQIKQNSQQWSSDLHFDYNENLVFSKDARQLLWLRTTPGDYFSKEPTHVSLKDLLIGKTVIDFTFPFDENILAKWHHSTLSPDGSLLASINNSDGAGFTHNRDGTIFMFDLKTKRVAWKHYETNFDTKAAVFSPDGKWLACGGYDLENSVPGYKSKGALLLLNVRTGEVAARFSEATWRDHTEESSTRQLVAIEKRLTSKVNYVGPQSFLPGDSGPISCLTFSPNGKLLAVGYDSGIIKLWRVPQ